MTALRLTGATFRTMDPAQPVVGELLVEGGRVTSRTAAAAPAEVDLRGACVLPGFTDAHVHFPTWSAAQQQVRLEGTRTIEEALDRVAAAARTLPEGRWLRGLGWRAGDWHPAVEPHRELLDRVAPGVPVALMSRDYHSLWVSSAGLARADGDLQEPGGVVEVDESGAPTGVLREVSAWSFRDRWSSPTADEYLEAMRDGVRLANRRGVTAIHDKDGWLGALALFQRLRSEGALTLRVWQSVPFQQLPALEALGMRSGFGDDLLRLGYVKAFMDGTLGSRTARLLDGSGVEILSRDAFAEVVRRAAEAGFPVAVHAIGDQANRDALDGFEATRDHWRPQGLRQRIEHAQLLAREDVGRFGALGITASVQFSHAPSDRDLAEDLWAGMTDRAYPFRSLLDSGATLVNGSDAPVEELEPLQGLRAGVLRTLDDRPAWHAEQAVPVEAALASMTVTPAWLARDEHRRGRLVPGLLADLVVLDRDPMTCPREELPEVRVLATMLAGEWVHRAPGYDV